MKLDEDVTVDSRRVAARLWQTLETVILVYALLLTGGITFYSWINSDVHPLGTLLLLSPLWYYPVKLVKRALYAGVEF